MGRTFAYKLIKYRNRHRHQRLAPAMDIGVFLVHNSDSVHTFLPKATEVNAVNLIHLNATPIDATCYCEHVSRYHLPSAFKS